MIGTKHGRLTVIAANDREYPNAGPFWLCRCDCGTETVVRGSYLKCGHTKSCGCLVMTHGSHRTPAYRSWQSMTQRCTNPKDPSWGRYGGRGITVCERWNMFANFLADMGPRPPGTTLDRINNDGNYGPLNCRWALPHQQYQSSSMTDVNDVGVCLIRHMRRRGANRRDIAHAFGVHPGTVSGIVTGRRRAPWVL